MKKLPPLFAPNQFATYSNNAFVLLGLVIQNVTGKSYESYIEETIFKPLNMTMSTMKSPPDDHAVLPADGHSWDVDQAVANPTGGIYSSSADLSKFLRYILTHYNALTTGVDWFKPASWAYGMNGFYGMPFEIFRTDRILASPNNNNGGGGSGGSARPVTFVTKSGGLPGYLSHVLLLEEYGLGITILVGSSGTDVFRPLLETVSVGLVRAAEAAVWRDIARKYPTEYVAAAASAAGSNDGGDDDDEQHDGWTPTGMRFASSSSSSSSTSFSSSDSSAHLDSALRLSSSPEHGLVVESFRSNGTDALATLAIRDQMLSPPGSRGAFRAQLVPTLLFKNETAQRGEIWRVVAVPVLHEPEYIWDDYCISDIDTMSYAGRPVNEVVFWHEDGTVELPAWKLTMKAVKGEAHREGLVVQG